MHQLQHRQQEDVRVLVVLDRLGLQILVHLGGVGAHRDELRLDGLGGRLSVLPDAAVVDVLFAVVAMAP